MLILIPKETNRLHYTMQLLLNQLLGLEIEFTVNITVFEQFEGPKFSYGVSVDNKYLFFASNNLLFERSITSRELYHFEYDGGIVFFPVNNKQSALPYDAFAASFYLVSRYEEYLPHLRDNHNRFLANGSDAFQKGYLNKPLVNIWSLKIKSILSTWFPQLIFSTPVFSFIPTIDIDSAYAYKNKGLTRALGGILKAIQNKNHDELRKRLRVLLGYDDDPFDTFTLQLELQKKYQYRAIYFILLADYGPNDKNIPYNNRNFRKLIRFLSDYADIGIHPSYASSLQPTLMVMETDRLSKIIKLEIDQSRQHFLKLVLPETYRNLINNDITHDYTMGYAENTGFRASVCTPFPFFDLDQDMSTSLIIHPFAVMDGTLHSYLKLTPEQATESIKTLINEVKAVGGTFIPLWHNQAFDEESTGKGWLDVYIRMVEEAQA
jgi:hypothetical protein